MGSTSTKNQQQIEATSWRRPGPQKSERVYSKRLPFERKNEIWGATLGPRGFWKGSQNHVVAHHVGKKHEKICLGSMKIGALGALGPEKYEIS